MSRTERTRVVKHDDDIIQTDVDVCANFCYGAQSAFDLRETLPLSIPSLPSRMAFSKLAKLFSG